MSDFVPNTLAGFKAAFFDASKRPLTEQDIFDAGVRSGMARVSTQSPQADAAPLTSIKSTCVDWDLVERMRNAEEIDSEEAGMIGAMMDALSREIDRLRAAIAAGGAQEAVNGVPATLRHDEGAIARCSYCGRYSLDPKTLSDRQPKCDCGERHGWCGSFEKPSIGAKWSGASPHPIVAATDTDRVDLIHALQKALFYWMPKVFDDRSAHDAYLLVGYEGETEPSCWGDEMVSAVPKWTPKAERLPIERGWYLAMLAPDNDWGLMSDTPLQVEFDAYKTKPKAFTCFYEWRGDEDITEAVTHWQPLPSAPAASNGEQEVRS